MQHFNTYAFSCRREHQFEDNLYYQAGRRSNPPSVLYTCTHISLYIYLSISISLSLYIYIYTIVTQHIISHHNVTYHGTLGTLETLCYTITYDDALYYNVMTQTMYSQCAKCSNITYYGSICYDIRQCIKTTIPNLALYARLSYTDAHTHTTLYYSIAKYTIPVRLYNIHVQNT